MDSVITKTIKIKSEKMPPEVDFIEEKIKKQGLEPLRWAIVEADKNHLTLSASGRTIL